MHRKSPKLSSGLIVKESKWGRELPPNAFGVLTLNTNKVGSKIIIFTSGTTMNHRRLEFNQNNFLHLCAFFTARKCIKDNWIKHSDEYIAPKVS